MRFLRFFCSLHKWFLFLKSVLRLCDERKAKKYIWNCLTIHALFSAFALDKIQVVPLPASSQDDIVKIARPAVFISVLCAYLHIMFKKKTISYMHIL